MGLFSEIKKGFKKITREFNRPVKQALDFFKGPEIPPLPPITPIAPLPTNISGGASDEILRRQRGRVSGRRKTIVTGELSPQQTGKKTLLGR